MLKVEVDSKALLKALDEAPRKTSLAVLRGIKRGTMSARTLASRTVAADIGLKVGEVRNAIRIKPPNANDLSGELSASLKRIPLIKFGAKGPEPSGGRGRGVTYRGKGGRKRIGHAFIATMPGGHRGVYQRKTKRALRRGPRTSGYSALPIRQLFGPSIGLILDKHKQAVMDRGAEVAIAEINRQVDRILD